MIIPSEIVELVERFDDNIEAYRSGKYKEAQLRNEFVNPFFKALGWDVYNEQGYAEAYKDVIHEDSIEVKGVVKAPDYCFRIGGVRKFFVEAKKPSISIKEEISPAFQLRRYAWSAKLPLSILTDFEEFAVYDCRIKPVKTDKAGTARTLYMDYQRYGDKWDEIYSIFSRDAILKGSFDKYVETSKRKRGTAEVDDAFLKEIESWREILAKNIALRNPGLTRRELNFAVQKTIDRIIFLRICEDRGIEDYGELRKLIFGDDIYSRLFRLFERADERYDSGLFHFSKEKERPESPDILTPNLKIDDKYLKDLIKRVYYPESPYEFSVLPADILGQVYEQFLGKVIRLTPKHRAVVEDKPEVKKAGGVYYTPTYIVDYIVENTVGKLLEGSNPKKAASIRILDPACGSGSFLIGAYQYLLDWHRDWYIENDAKKWGRGRKPRLYQDATGGWKLTTTERKRILLNNIYGVDIDPQAVEVTKLSLLLKVLEEETKQTIGTQLEFYQERALPDLSKNIKCGNSLVGPDFYEQQQISIIDEEKAYRINSFNWNDEFPNIFSRSKSGFDTVIGNPPYVRQEILGELKDYFSKKYETYHGVADLYVYFIEKGVSLLNSNGIFGIIVASKWLKTNYGKPLRNWLSNKDIREIIDFGSLSVFPKVTTYPCIIIISGRDPSLHINITKVKDLNFGSLSEYVDKHKYVIKQSSLSSAGWSLLDTETTDLLDRLDNIGLPLKEYVSNNIYYGIKTGLNKAFVIDADTRRYLIKKDISSKEIIKDFLVGKDIRRYEPLTPTRYVIFTRRGVNIKKYPAIEQYLKNFKDNLKPKPKGWDGGKWKGRKPGPYKWYEIQDTVDYYLEFDKPKIFWPGISSEITSFTYDDMGYYGNDNTQFIVTDDYYLLGILNSKLTKLYLSNICDKVQGGFYRLKMIYIQQIPIINVDSSDIKKNKLHDSLVELVENMLGLHRKIQKAKYEQDKVLIQRQIENIDHQIDRLVYGLYDLSKKEIEYVEKAF